MAKKANVTKSKTPMPSVVRKPTGKVGGMKPPGKAVPSAKMGGSKKTKKY